MHWISIALVSILIIITCMAFKLIIEKLFNLAIIDGFQGLIDKMKEYSLDASAGLMICRGKMLKIVYIDEKLKKLLGNPRAVEDIIPQSLRLKHRDLVNRFVGDGQLPDSLNHPLRNVPVKTDHDGVIHARLIIGRFGSHLWFLNSIYYVVMQPNMKSTAFIRRGSSQSIGANSSFRQGSFGSTNANPRDDSIKPSMSTLSNCSFFSDSQEFSLPNGDLQNIQQCRNTSSDNACVKVSGSHEEDAAGASQPSDDFQSLVEVYGFGAAAYVDRGLVPATERYGQATVLYMDIVDFTRHCMTKPLDKISEWMTRIHGTIDVLLERYSVRKVETRGDCVICVTGTNFVAEAGGTSRDLCCDQASRMLSFGHDLGLALSALQGTQARMGMASGPVVLTHISHGGDTLPAKYIYGDTVNVACRMEQTGRVGAIQLEESAARIYARERGAAPPPLFWRQIKGKGALRTAFYDYMEGAGCFLEEPPLDSPLAASAKYQLPIHAAA